MPDRDIISDDEEYVVIPTLQQVEELQATISQQVDDLERQESALRDTREQVRLLTLAHSNEKQRVSELRVFSQELEERWRMQEEERQQVAVERARAQREEATRAVRRQLEGGGARAEATLRQRRRVTPTTARPKVLFANPNRWKSR